MLNRSNSQTDNLTEFCNTFQAGIESLCEYIDLCSIGGVAIHSMLKRALNPSQLQTAERRAAVAIHSMLKRALNRPENSAFLGVLSGNPLDAQAGIESKLTNGTSCTVGGNPLDAQAGIESLVGLRLVGVVVPVAIHSMLKRALNRQHEAETVPFARDGNPLDAQAGG